MQGKCLKANIIIMKKFLFLFFLITFSNFSYALIEVDITRGNLDPLPVAVSALSIDENSRKNFRIELSLLPFFLLILCYLFTNNSSLLFISLLILIKELFIVLLRLYFLSSQTIKIKKYYIYLFIFPLLLIFSFLNMNLFYILIIILIILTFINVKHNI